MSDPAVIRLKPNEYIHVLDNNLNVTRVEVGPMTFTRQDHHKVVAGPEAMIIVPPRHYCVISNPVVRNAAGEPVADNHGQVRVRHGDEEIRFSSDPFPLFPGEKLFGSVSPLQVVGPNQALRLRAIRDFAAVAEDGKPVVHQAGDEWLCEGPVTYIPAVEVQVVEVIRAVIVKPNQALKLRARKEFAAGGVKRKAGEEYLMSTPGAYMPGVSEEVVETINAYVLTDKKALHLRANQTYVDVFGATRKAGEEWLVTSREAPTHIPGVFEKVIGEVRVTTLTNRQYCVVVDPWDVKANKLRLGQRELRKGEVSFFLRPGERLEVGIQNVNVLGEEEALLLRAKEAVVEEGARREPGDRWMVYGPRDYIPPIEVEVLERRKAIALDTNEGVYIRDIKDGRISMVTGKSYMLKPNEELWEKDLPSVVEGLLRRDFVVDAAAAAAAQAAADASPAAPRVKSSVVTYRAPHNTAVQLYDYKNKKARVVLGPELVMLGPEEQFTVLSLSGDKPKRPHVIKAIALFLGPDFMTDIVVVETSDHARLSLKLSYNWHFEVPPEDPSKIFQVPDFVGDSCKAIASRVRGVVAQTTFDTFHKLSASIIRGAVFGEEAPGRPRNRFMFSANNLVISNIDIQSVEPVDQRTRDSLQKSVQLAIEITTKSQEAAARHEAERLEQEARGKLERQKINDEAEAEKAKMELIQLQAQSATVEQTGQLTADAKANAGARQIQAEADLKLATLKAKAKTIKETKDLETLRARQLVEVEHQKMLDDLEVYRTSALAKVDAEKFQKIVAAIGPKNIAAIARAGPEMQARLLKGLGLKSLMITDGNSPINLFGTAQGLIANAGAAQ